jgi:hypothetical protein
MSRLYRILLLADSLPAPLLLEAEKALVAALVAREAVLVRHQSLMILSGKH